MSWRFAKLLAVCLFALACSLVMLRQTGAVQAPSQNDAGTGIERAGARLQANDAAGAAQILQTVVRSNPANARVWRMLGMAYQQLKHHDEALSAYRKSLELEPGSPTTFYRIGCVQALRKDKEQAFEWLQKARATHKLDMTQITVDPDLVSLKSDRRFQTLLPMPKDFANPFEEPVSIVREWDGEAANDQFGWIARNIGDVDGDGVPDLVTSAPTKDIGGENAGRVYVYSTRTGKLIWQADGKPGDQLGSGVEGAGDTNGDGVPDVIASAPYAGKAMIYSGRDGRVLATLSAENKDDEFGQHVSTAGDVNRDGYADVIVGAPGNSATGRRAGRAYVFSGKDGRLLLTLSGEREGDEFGSAVAGYSDTNRTILIVGAPKAGPRKTGRTYVYKQLSSKPAFIIESDKTGRALGAMFLSVVGDVDGDGMPDVYASDWTNAAKGPSTGRVYIRSGADGHSLFTLTGETAGEDFGIGVARAGDVDGDGHADLIIGSWQYAGQAVSGGRAYLYSGRDGRLIRTYTCKTPGDTFGFDAVGMGDVDGDGTIDFLITSAWSGIHGYHSGRVFIISSGVKTLRK